MPKLISRSISVHLCSSVVALACFCISTSFAAPKTATYRFLDWQDVEKGHIVATYDASRLTDEAKKAFAQTQKDFGIIARTNGHGIMSYHVPSGIQITVEKAKKTPRFIAADQPWEDDVSGGNVIIEKGKFRCWYSIGMPKVRKGVVYVAEGRAMETNGTSICYAESEDGLHWIKPNVGLFSFYGSKSNNIVSELWIDSPFLDEHGKPEERYKAFTFDELPADELPKNVSAFNKYGLYGVVSADGYKWIRQPKPLVRHFADTWNIAGWDPVLKKYVGYFRGHTGGRSITRAETDDFHNWPMPQTVFCVGPEEAPTIDYYSSGYTTYPGEPGIRLMFPGIFHLNTSLIDGRVALSRDGYGWNWISHDTIIENGATNEWDSAMIFGQPNMVRLPDGRLALPYSAYNEGHDIAYTGEYKDWPKHETGLAWAIWEDDRLAGIEATNTGEFYAANKLSNVTTVEINARAAADGRIEAELVERDNVLPGFSFADCVPLTGNNVWTPLRWKDKTLADAKGKKVQIHFRLTKAKIFAYRTAQ